MKKYNMFTNDEKKEYKKVKRLTTKYNIPLRVNDIGKVNFGGEHWYQLTTNTSIAPRTMLKAQIKLHKKGLFNW